MTRKESKNFSKSIILLISLFYLLERTFELSISNISYNLQFGIRITGIQEVPDPHFIEITGTHEVKGEIYFDGRSVGRGLVSFYYSNYGIELYDIDLQSMPNDFKSRFSGLIAFSKIESIEKVKDENQNDNLIIKAHSLGEDLMSVSHEVTVVCYDEVNNFTELKTLLMQIVSYKKSIVDYLRKGVYDSIEQYTIVAKDLLSYEDEMKLTDAIIEINNELRNITEWKMSLETEKKNLEIKNEAQKILVDDNLRIKDQKYDIWQDCLNEAKKIKDEIEKQSKESDGISKEEYEINIEILISNAGCKFRLEMEDIKLMLPNEIRSINKIISSILKEKKYDDGLALLHEYDPIK